MTIIRGAAHRVGSDPLIFLKERFDGYLADRQANPQPDLLTELAGSRYRDGSEPAFERFSLLARFLFGAGQDTTSRVIAIGIASLATIPSFRRSCAPSLGGSPTSSRKCCVSIRR